MKETIPYHKPLNIEVDFTDIFESGMLTNDKYCKLLELEIQKIYNVDHVLTTANCTMGLMLCLKYWNPSYIQVPMFNWWSDLYVLDFLNIAIAWNDIDRKTWLPIEKYGGASLYLNTFGSIGKSIKQNAIYDASHCLGAELEEIGLASVISLAPTKLITSCEGGLILTNNTGLYVKCMEWRNKMCRMSELHAKTGLETLKSLDKIKEWKRTVYNYYKKNIPGQFQEILDNSNYNTIGFLNTKKLKIPEHIEYKQYYEPIHYDKMSNANLIYKNIVCLPSYYGVDYKQIVYDILEVYK